MAGYGSTHTDYVRQQIRIPSGVSTATLAFYLHLDTAVAGSMACDTIQVQVITATGKQIALATYPSQDAASGYQQRTISLDDYKGQTLQINFSSSERGTKQTSFVVDDVSVKTQ